MSDYAIQLTIDLSLKLCVELTIIRDSSNQPFNTIVDYIFLIFSSF